MQELIWMPSTRGKVVDILRPTPTQVDFLDIADALSLVNRYSGNSEKPVSVALHTLIVCDAVDEPLKPYALLHDAHEARIGDATTPFVRALAEVALDLDPRAGTIIERAMRELKRRHDHAIYAAAGLAVPSASTLAVIREADAVAMLTERRDFLCRQQRMWEVDARKLKPLPRVYRLRSAPDIAAELYARFIHHLPALSATRRTFADA